MAGVEVGAQDIPHRGPQAQQGGRVVHAEAGMHLKGYFFHAVGFSDIRRFFPVRDQHVIPLVLQGFAILGRPGAGDPVGALGFRAVAGTAGEGHDGIHPQLLCQLAGVHKHVVIHLGRGFIRVHRIAVAGQHADFQLVLFEQLLKFLDFPVVV